MALFLLWLVLALLVGAYAGSRGRSFLGFFLLSVLLSPLIGLLFVLIAGPNARRLEREQISRGEKRRCPHCAEPVQREARICRYCGQELTAPVVLGFSGYLLRGPKAFGPTLEQHDKFAEALKSRAKPPAN